MGDEITTVLRLVSEGKLSPEEAAPIIEALGLSAAAPPPPRAHNDAAARTGTTGKGRRVRIQVSERGHKVIDFRVPLAFAAMAARSVPGIPASYAELIDEAIERDQVGPIVDTEDDDGDAILISVE